MYIATDFNRLERDAAPSTIARETVLTELRTLLSNHESGYVMVTGHAGAGKSVLLGSLIQSLASAEAAEIQPVFHSITGSSCGNEEAALLSLLRQLNAVQQILPSLPDSTSAMREHFAWLLRNWHREWPPVAILLDGIDLADRWFFEGSLFPARLPRNVFVVLAARPLPDQDWLDVLSLPAKETVTVALKPLERPEIRKLLSASGGPARVLAEDPLLVAQVARVSLGEPIFIQCLVDSLESAAISPGALSAGLPSLTSRLEEWWREVELSSHWPAARDLILLLTAARGPLGAADILRLGIKNLDVTTLDTTVWSLRRFIAGSRESGYYISSPLLKRYLATRFRSEMEGYYGYEAIILRELHERYRSGRHEDSHYAWEYLDLHDLSSYARSNLLGRENFAGKRRRFGSHRRYAADLDRVLSQPEVPTSMDRGLEYLSENWLYASLTESARYVPPAALGLLAHLGQTSQAADLVALMPSAEDRVAAHLIVGDSRRWITGSTVAPSLTEPRHLDTELLQKALEEALRHPTGETRNIMLSSIATVLARAGLMVDARLAIEAIGPVSDEDYAHLRHRALISAAEELARAGRVEDALALATSSELTVDERESALSQVAFGLGEIGLPVSALEVVLRLPETSRCFPHDLLLIWNISKESFLELLRSADAIETPRSRAAALRELALVLEERRLRHREESVPIYDANRVRGERLNSLMWLGQYDRVIEIDLALFGDTHVWDRSGDRHDLLLALLADGRAEELQHLLKRHADQADLAILERWVTRWQAYRTAIRLGRAEGVLLDIDESIADPYVRGQTAAVLAPELCRSDAQAQLAAWFSLDEHRDERNIISATAFVARSGQHAAAEELAVQCLTYSSSMFLRQAFHAIAGALAGVGQVDKILPLARRLISHRNGRCDALAQVSRSLSVIDHYEAVKLMEAALEDAERGAWHPADLNPVWTALAREAVLEQEWDTARILVDRVGIDDCAAWAVVSAHYIQEMVRRTPEQGQAVLEGRLAFLHQDTLDNEFTRSLLPGALQALQSELVACGGLDDLAMIVAQRADGQAGLAVLHAQMAARLASSDPEAAKKMVQEALAMYPANSADSSKHEFLSPNESLSMVLLQAGWIEGALAVLPDDYDAEHREWLQHQLALQLYGKGAATALDTLVPLPSDVGAEIAAIRYAEAGEFDKAIVQVEAIPDGNPSQQGELLMEVAQICVDRRQIAEAVSAMSRLQEGWPEADPARLALVARGSIIEAWDGLNLLVGQMNDSELRGIAQCLTTPKALGANREWAGTRLKYHIERVLDSAADNQQRRRVLSYAVYGLAVTTELACFRSLGHRIWDLSMRDDLFATCAFALARLGRTEDGTELVSCITENQTRTRALESVIATLQGKQGEKVWQALPTIMKVARQGGRSSCAAAIAAMIPVIAELAEEVAAGQGQLLELARLIEEKEDWLATSAASSDPDNNAR